MCPQLFVGCSGWNYGDSSEKGGWLNVFYPDNKTHKLNYYSQFFNTVEMDATFYNRFYQHAIVIKKSSSYLPSMFSSHF